MNNEPGKELSTEVQCNSCGAMVAPGAFCRRCGAPMSGVLVEPDEEADESRPKRWVLMAGGAVVALAVVVGAVTLLTGESGEQDLSSIEAEETVQSTSEDVTATSAAVPETTLAETPSTTLAPEVSTTTAGLPIGLSDSLLRAEPFRYSFPDGLMPPGLPKTLEGHVVYEGSDAAGLAGRVRTATLRVFEGTNALMPTPEFSTQMNGCGDTYWVLRWVVKNPDVRIVASNELDPILSSDGFVEDEPWLLPPEARAGLMGNSICFAPGFQFSSTVNGNEANLADVAVEWTYFDRDLFADTGSEASPSSGSCSTYTYDVSLPIGLCAEGPAVATLQEALGLEADGYFGPGTEQAVRDFQQNAGIAVTGVVDRLDWSFIGPADYGVVGPLD